MNRGNQGFVLITGVIFLAVMALLALATLATSRLQVQMANNHRQRLRAQAAAAIALREGEHQLARLPTCPLPGRSYDLRGRAAGDATGEASKWWLWREGQPIAGTGGFRDPGVWADDPAVTDPVSNQASRGLPGVSKRPRMYIEQLRAFRPRDLNPDTRARAQGAGLYRITARASGGSPGAMVIVQVLYRKRF